MRDWEGKLIMLTFTFFISVLKPLFSTFLKALAGRGKR